MKGKPRILIVDDLAEQRTLIRYLLQDRYSVATAASAGEAFRYLNDKPVNLVLLDITMPGVDGITALEKIKKKYSAEVVIVSSCSHPGIMKKALGLGAFRYIKKPFDRNELFDTVEKALNNCSS